MPGVEVDPHRLEMTRALKVVQDHGGTILPWCQADRAIQFTVVLPLAPGPSSSPQP